jgi:hypothetical protein
MSNIDRILLPCDPLQYYYIHYILKKKNNHNDKFLTRCKPVTRGYIHTTYIIDVNRKLLMIPSSFYRLTHYPHRHTERSLAESRQDKVDPQDDRIGIYGIRPHDENLAFETPIFEIADRIALHINNIIEKRD